MKRFILAAFLFVLVWNVRIGNSWCKSPARTSDCGRGKSQSICNGKPECCDWCSYKGAKAGCSSMGYCQCKTAWAGSKCLGCANGYYKRTPITRHSWCVKCGTCQGVGVRVWYCNSWGGHCNCKPGYKGSKCTDCGSRYHKQGSVCCPFTHYHVNGICTKCPCRSKRVGHAQYCDDNGYCNCMSPFSRSSGQKTCDTCIGNGNCCPHDLTLYYDNVKKACTKCICNPLGVTTSGRHCTNDHICHCRPGYTGPKCNQCTGNFWQVGLECKALPVYHENSVPVSVVPFPDKCAFDGYDLMVKNYFLFNFTKVASFARCREHCLQFGECVDYIYDFSDPFNTVCYLVSRLGFANDDFTNLPINGYRECPTSDGCVFPDRLYFTYYHLKVIHSIDSPYDCQQMCEEFNGCVFFVYSMSAPTMDGQTCYLKNHKLGTVYQGKEKMGVYEAKNFVSGSISCAKCYWFNSQLDIIPNLKHVNGQKHVVVLSYEECQSYCEQHRHCTFFQYNSETEQCYLKNEKTLLARNAKRAVGQRDCNIECGKCNKDGVLNRNDLTCDKVGNCKCKPNYADKECNRCDVGFRKAADGSCVRKQG